MADTLTALVAPSPAPVTPSPSPSPAPTSAVELENPGLKSAFDELDKLDADPTPPEPAKEAPSSDKPPESTAPNKDAPKEAAKSKTEDDIEVPTTRTPKELREWGKSQAKLAKDKEKEITRLNERLKALESSPRETGREETAVKERLATLEKQLEERDNEVKLFRYERSQEFDDKFQKPYVQGLKAAYALVTGLTVKEKGATPDDPPTERQAAQKDFDAVLSLSEGPAWRKAKELFGEDAQIVYTHYQKLFGIKQDADNAISTHRQKAAEQEKTDIATRARETEGISKMWREANDGLQNKYPKWFKPVEGDEEGNKLLENGYQMADSFFTQRASMTPQQRVILDAQVRNRTAAFPRLVFQLKQARTELEAAKKELQGFKESTPGKPKRTSDGKFVSTETPRFEDAIDALRD